MGTTEETEKYKIFLQALRRGDEGFRYSESYTIDLPQAQLSKYPCAALSSDVGFNSMVSLGSIIYVVGSLSHDQLITFKIKPPHSGCHNFMSYLDLAGNDGWKQAPCPSQGPCSTRAVVAFAAKIYLFSYGGVSDTAQVFDPISNTWETLLPPPTVGHFDIGFLTSAVADPHNNRILVHFATTQSVFAYYPVNNQWELLLKPFTWSSLLVFVHGMILICLPDFPELIVAYHVDTKQWLNIVFTSELSHRYYYYNAMFHVGGDLLCLATYSYVPSPSQTHIKLLKLKFKRSTHNPTDLLITPLPEETYTIDGRCRVYNYLPF